MTSTAGWQGVVTTLSAVPFNRFYQAACALLLVWLLYLMAQLSWLLLPLSDESSTALPLASMVSVGNTANNRRRVDVDTLQSLNLFGPLGATSVVEQPVQATVVEDVDTNAKKTRLDIQLEGIVFSSEPSQALAFIVHKGTQHQYSVGDKLPVGNRVILARVLIDRVIIENNGRHESLWLYDLSETQSRQVQTEPARSTISRDLRANAQATSLASNYRKQLYKNPSSLAEAVKISPVQENGQMQGYRVSPGRDKKQFAEFGFKAGDIVTSINEITLDDPARALDVYQLMRTAREAFFTVQRGGETIELSVSLDDGNS